MFCVIKKKIYYIFTTFIFLLFLQGIASSEWITKKSDISKKLTKVDDMYANGYLTKPECIKAKAKLLKISESSMPGMCDNIIVKNNVTDVSATSKNIKSRNQIDRFENLPNSEFYFYAFKRNDIFLVGYANQDTSSKMINVKGRKFRKGNSGVAFKNDGTDCFVYSEVDENSLGNRSYTGNVKVYCDDKSNYIGNWVQYGEKGNGTAINSVSGENIDFNFTMNKYLALSDLNKNRENTEIAKNEKIEEFVPKNLKEDNEPPIIKISKSIKVKDSNYKIVGKVEDKSDKIFIEVDGQTILAKNGKFEINRFSPINEKIEITAIDKWGNISEPVTVSIVIDNNNKTIANKLEPLNPSNIESKINKNKIAIIFGIEKYNQTPAATYANLDAKFFYEYAQKSFGVSKSNIKILVDEDANLIDSLGTLNKWLPSKITKNQSELLIFFAGHGLASNDGSKLFLLPQDSDPDLLERTALSRSELFETILKLKPKNVTMFFDTCFSGISRDEKTLLASARPVRIISDKQSKIPKNFTIFSASKLNQISSGLAEAKHGIFSYYLMKGLEGNADNNKDRKITNGELLAYMINNVSQKAAELGREQIPSLEGDPSKVLVTY